MTNSQVEALGAGYAFALVGCAACAGIAAIVAYFIRFTPSQVAQAQAAQDEVITH